MPRGGRWQTFRRVILPGIRPALLTGFALAFARGLGEYGSGEHVFIRPRNVQVFVQDYSI